MTFPRLSIAGKLYAIFGLLASATVGLALVGVVNSRQHAAITDQFESAFHGSINVERVNALIYAWSSYPLRFIATNEEFGDRWAFIAKDILSGEWWRMLSYLFVHANWLHLLMNLLGLWVLGPFVERAFGWLRFSLIYLFSGFTGSVVYLCLFWYQLGDPSAEPPALVGASGCIMGLLGATAAVMLRAWVKQRAPMAKQILFRILVVVALQVTFDYNTPQVAGLAHALGLLGGFIAGLLLHERVSAERSVEPLT